jgi:hypothetical protein
MNSQRQNRVAIIQNNMKEGKHISLHNRESGQILCPKCYENRTIQPQIRTNSQRHCPRCEGSGWTEEGTHANDKEVQPRTIYVSEAYYYELTGKRRTNMSEEEKEDTKKAFADAELFEARVEEIQKKLEEKPRRVFATHKDGKGSAELNETKGDIEEAD